jgi:hypothetical protein
LLNGHYTIAFFFNIQMHIHNNNKMVAYNVHFHSRRAPCADPRTTKQLQTLKQLQVVNKKKNMI